MNDLYVLGKDLIEKLNKAYETSFAISKDMEHIKDPEDAPKTLILYADGGCDMTRGPAGGGVHGFWFDKYTSEKVVRADNDFTRIGYLPKNDRQQLEASLFTASDITLAKLLGMDPTDKAGLKEMRAALKKRSMPKKYLDAFDKQPFILGYLDLTIPVKAPGSNNIGELAGLIGAMQIIIESYEKEQFEEFYLYLDSMYALGAYRNIFRYAAKNWMGTSGEELKNKEHLQRIYRLATKLKELDLLDKIHHIWVKGHSSNNGNDRADAAASRGKSLSWQGVYPPSMEVVGLSEKEKTSYKDFSRGYWGVENDYSRFLCLTDWYMQTNIEQSKDAENRFVVPMATGKSTNDGQEGKTDSTVRNAVLFTREMDPVLKKVSAHQRTVHGDLCQDIYKVRLNRILSPAVYNDINLRGLRYVHSRDNTYSLVHWTSVPITKQLRPARIAYKEIDRLNLLVNQTNTFKTLVANPKECGKTYAVADISDVIWEPKPEAPEKGKKAKRKCLLGNNDRIINVEIPVAGDIKYKLRCLVDMDLPPRNLMANIADDDPKLYVMTAVISDLMVGEDRVINFEYWFFLGNDGLDGELLAWSAPNRNKIQHIIKGKKK